MAIMYCTDNEQTMDHTFTGFFYMLFESSWLAEVNLMFERSNLIFETKYTYIELLKPQTSFGP